MKFLPTELNITDYMQRLSDMLNDENCHVFIDTNILSQLYKLNDNARGEFMTWADSIEGRFHIPNWVVVEYNKRVKSKRLADYVDELRKIKSIKKELANLQRFLWGYVDDDILQGSVYHGNKDGLHNDLKVIVDSYVNIADVVTKKNSERLKKVEQDVKRRLDKYVVDTDIYHIMQDSTQNAPLRFENKIPPGCADDVKEANRTGDLIIWQEIIDCCSRNDWTKVIYISRDLKDLYYKPDKQLKDGDVIKNEDDKKNIVHESLIYEYEVATGSNDIAVIDFSTLVQLLSDKYTELAFSFQMVSRSSSPADNDDDDLDWLLELFGNQPDVVQPANQDVHPAENAGIEGLEYQQEAIRDSLYLDACNNKELKACIERLKSYNWYTQNDAVEYLYNLLTKEWPENIENKNAFFVIGRNLLQSADGNAFEAVRFIKDMSHLLRGKQSFLKKAIVDGCIFEVFFDSNGEIRRKGFKARYYDIVVEQARECLADEAFVFINERLSHINDRFVPVVGGDNEYTFEFEIQQPVNELDNYHTISLTINGQDNSESFSKPLPSEFAYYNDIERCLSIYYAVPEDKIHKEGIPENLTSLRYIKEEVDDDILG